jgi:serine protease AprX
LNYCLASRVRWGMWPATSSFFVALLVLFAIQLAGRDVPTPLSSTTQATTVSSSSLEKLAADHPGASVEVIVQLQPGVTFEQGRKRVHSLGGRITGDLHIIRGLAVHMSAQAAKKLAAQHELVRAVSLNARVKPQAVDTSLLATRYNQSVYSPNAWNNYGMTGKGVGVAVIDTGIAGDLPDFRVSQTQGSSRVVASAVTNPYAKNAGDSYGHGTHVAGIIGGNGTYRPASDPLYGKYIGVAPDANLISVKASDEQGNATILDVIYGLQFVVDHKSDYNIRVVNLSLESTQAQSYKTDPLDAAAESAWFNGIVVVAAAGNRGASADAVSYAPGNDPYVISVGAVDDKGTNATSDDGYASWSSVGLTQDGYLKPDVSAPGAHIVSALAPKSQFTSLCPSCIVDGQYIRAGGTSMAAPMVSGAVANLLQLRPQLRPDQVKGVLMANLRSLPSGVNELNVNRALAPNNSVLPANVGLTPNTLIDSSTGAIDYTRSSWSRSSWSRSSWSRSSWSCNCSKTASGSIDPTRSSWSRSSWSMSWTK